MEKKRKSLLEKYEIPLNHLDFVYIVNCKNAREMEKIVQILRSGEEGYFPDLTKCAEDKLQELKPGSKLFRLEEKIRSREFLKMNEWKPIYDWTHEIKSKDHKLTEAKNHETAELELPPIRTGGKINSNVKTDSNAGDVDSTSGCKALDRIKYTDYRKWDQYDADVEILRMDLAEERVLEEVDKKNRQNLQKSSLPLMITEITKEDKEHELLKKLTDVELEKLAEEYRLRGNEYFRAKEYDNAIKEYGLSIQLNPAAASYNNRAIANMKLQKFQESIEDCVHCLSLEPNNLKARLRLAEATYSCGRRRESYDLYLNVLELDPTNTVATKATMQLRTELGQLPPINATRIVIQDDKPATSEGQCPRVSTAKLQAIAAKPKEYDLADLVVPNRVIKNKFATAAESLSSLKSVSGSQRNPNEAKQSILPSSLPCIGALPTEEIRLPCNVPKTSMGKMLIEEI